MQPTPQDVLLIVDVQNDFCPGGALAVPDGDAILPVLNCLASSFEHLVLTQDWHPPGHISFASAHAGKRPFEPVRLDYGMQTLWPDHCIQGSRGAEFHPALDLSRAEFVQRKGSHSRIDSYSAFFENDRQTPTGLGDWLRNRNLTRVFLAGLAYDFCVGFSALDARCLGFEAIVLRDACRAIQMDGSVEAIEAAFAVAGVQVVDCAQLLS